MTKTNMPLFSDYDRNAIRAAAKKPLIYLDSCVWIDVAERFPNLSQQCQSLVQREKAIFPVSLPTVIEVIKQPTADKRAHVAALMDQLSKGLCFRNSKAIHETEANLALPVILGAPAGTIKREEILTWVVEFAERMAIRIPTSWSFADADRFTRWLAAKPELRSVKWLVDHSPLGQMRREQSGRMEGYVQGMTDLIEKNAPHYQHLSKSIRWKLALLEERVSVVEKLVSPRMSQNLLNAVGPEKLLNTVAAISKHIGEGGEHRLDQIMRAMPSLDLYCHIMAERGRNHSRKARQQDFFDVEHAVVGGVYSDYFVTSDKNLFDLITLRCKISATHGCRVARGAEGLEEVLKQIAN